jgi:FMN phosphatase YigB (HAD superfamily)
MYVGDNPQADIEGARNAGLTAVWKSVPYWKLSITDVSKIDSLSELLTMVDSDPYLDASTTARLLPHCA